MEVKSLLARGRDSILGKAVFVGILVIVLLIPLQMIRSVIQEREWRRDSAAQEVGSKWGDRQTIVGPILSVPYTVHTTLPSRAVEERTEYVHVLPNDLVVTGNLSPEMLHRGIYDIVTYNAALEFKGSFDAASLDNLNVPAADLRWDKATISVNIPDMRGVQEEVKLMWDGAALAMHPGSTFGFDYAMVPAVPVSMDDPYTYDTAYPTTYLLPPGGSMRSGVHSGVSVDRIRTARASVPFSFSLSVNGTEALNFIPAGSTTKVELTSAWNTPSFNGAFLPDERVVTDEGFQASWNVLELNRGYSQRVIQDDLSSVYQSVFGVDLMTPVDQYHKTTRAVKYGIMLIAMTFLIFYFVEVLNGVRVHPVQYILVGLALCIFFLLLLSLSEHMSFNIAYALSTLATVGLISMYSKYIFKETRLTIVQAGILLLVYLFMFVTIQLEEYALLIGSLGLFVVLATVMYISRKVDWYAVGEPKVH